MEMRRQIFMFNSNNEIELAKNNHFYFKDSEQLEYKINLRGAIKED